MMGKEYRFDAEIQQNPDMDAACIIFPYDIRTAHERRMGKGINDESKTIPQRKNKDIQCHLR